MSSQQPSGFDPKNPQPAKDLAFADVTHVLLHDGWHTVLPGSFVGGTSTPNGPAIQFFLWLEGGPGDVVTEVMCPSPHMLAMKGHYAPESPIKVVSAAALHAFKH